VFLCLFLSGWENCLSLLGSICFECRELVLTTLIDPSDGPTNSWTIHGLWYVGSSSMKRKNAKRESR